MALEDRAAGRCGLSICRSGRGPPAGLTPGTSARNISDHAPELKRWFPVPPAEQGGLALLHLYGVGVGVGGDHDPPPGPTTSSMNTPSADFPTSRRKVLMAFLVSAFALQTFLVYSDDTGRDLPPLSDEALEGRAVWLSNNCQACHQFYGFGGFLGPDLTNAASRLDRARLDEVLTKGVAQMPAFHLSDTEIGAIEAYLREMDGTGIGQARVPLPDLPAFREGIRDAIDGGTMSAEASKGGEGFLSGACTACHAALAPQRIGAYLAPDLSSAVNDLSDDEILTVLEVGRPALGMPPAGFSASQRGEMLAFLRWLAANRTQLQERTRGGDSGGIPWWEFR